MQLRNFFWIVLLPLSFAWAGLMFLRRRFYPKSWKYRSRLTTICVGNLHSGGSGKTPLVLSLAEHFFQRKPVIVSRGYRGSNSGSAVRVDLKKPGGASFYGDEPWMMANKMKVPVYVGKNRVHVIQFIERAAENPLVLLDDGFQHLRLHRDVDLVAISSERSIEDSFCLPWGELREPYSALAQATAIVLTYGNSSKVAKDWRAFLKQAAPGIPVFEAKRVVDGLWQGEREYVLSENERLAAFCGIARPQSFIEDLSHFPNVQFLRAFSDHSDYNERVVLSLIESANLQGSSVFVTTEKDWFKAKPFFARQGRELLALRIRYEFLSDFWYFLETKMGMQ